MQPCITANTVSVMYYMYVSSLGYTFISKATSEQENATQTNKYHLNEAHNVLFFFYISMVMTEAVVRCNYATYNR